MKYKSIGNSWQYGSIGGCTYSKNRFGAFARNRAIPTNPQSILQSAVRNNFASLSAAWRNELTAAERDLWNAYASLSKKTKYGEEYTPLGINYYVAINALRLLGGFTRIDDAPTTGGGTILTTPAVVPSAPDDFQFTYSNTDEWATAVGGHLYAFAGRAVPGSNNSYQGSFQYAGAINGAVVPPTSPGILVSPITWPGDASLKVFARFIAQAADGRLSIPVTDSAFVIP